LCFYLAFPQKIVYKIDKSKKGGTMKPREVMERLKAAADWTEGKGREHAIVAISPSGYRVPIGNHPSKDIPIGTLKKIERLTGVKLR
jgi:predicted RNA binding protein YcfA (HicA-like mRNA interferase family)